MAFDRLASDTLTMQALKFICLAAELAPPVANPKQKWSSLQNNRVLVKPRLGLGFHDPEMDLPF